jgi:hypothetical protein
MALIDAIRAVQTRVATIVGADQSPYFGDRPSGGDPNAATALPPPNKNSYPSNPRPNDTGDTVVLVSPISAGRAYDISRPVYRLKVGVQFERSSLREASADLSAALSQLQQTFQYGQACIDGVSVDLIGGRNGECDAFLIFPLETLPEFRHTPGLAGVRLILGFIVEVAT